MKYPQLVSMPSAISDWLEEQLESRGIDAVVYTRYVLSLLHRDTLDLVSTEPDIQLPKEVRLSGRGRKRFRRSTEWWSHVRADVEQLRRSAAVECLMSASDQKCGIESLVDELCEKLKHFESSASDNADLGEDQSGNKLERNTISPNDLARRYYAAFPPLNYTKTGPANNLITLIPQLYATSGSNKRKHGRKLPAHHQSQHRRSTSRDRLQRKADLENMKARSGGKPQRFSYFGRSKRDFGFARNMEKSVDRADALSDWDVYFLNGQHNSRVGDEGYSTSDTAGVDESEDACEVVGGRRSDKCKSAIDDGHLAKLVAKFDRRIEALWHTDEEASCAEQNAENEYHDLPVDIQELLASPAKHEPTAVELLNSANRRASGKPARPFIQCGTNITSSIWSECADEDKSLYDSISYCNLYNEALEQAAYPDNILGDQFNSLSMGAQTLSDDILLATVTTHSALAENETNLLYEERCAGNNKLCFSNMRLGSLRQNEFTSLPWELAFPVGSVHGTKRWSDAENYGYGSPLEEDASSRAVNDSLLTLNHNKECSVFEEVVPKQVVGAVAVVPSDPAAGADSQPAADAAAAAAKDEEDLLTSTRTHFRPIRQETSAEACTHGRYADGTTFAIRSSLEHVNYRRSDSGTLYLESGFDTPKRYMEYRPEAGSPDPESRRSAEQRAFVLKFCVQQNEKCCQTEPGVACDVTAHSPLEVPAKKRVLCDPEEFFFPGDDELLSDSLDGGACECSCTRTRAHLATSLEPLFNASSETCRVHAARSDSGTALWQQCDKCTQSWGAAWPAAAGGAGDGWQSWQHIWSSDEELCRTCLGVPAGPGAPAGRSLEYCKLRDELSEDGEQLLSDLSCLQRNYMEQLPSAEACEPPLPGGPAPGASAAAGTLLDSVGVPSKERKRRHSSSQRPGEPVLAAAVARNSWTNNSCLRADQRCAFTPPVLRPVTL